jgi:hypothetical protein
MSAPWTRTPAAVRPIANRSKRTPVKPFLKPAEAAPPTGKRTFKKGLRGKAEKLAGMPLRTLTLTRVACIFPAHLVAAALPGELKCPFLTNSH